MTRPLLSLFAALLLVAGAAPALAIHQDERVHHLAIHVDQNDPAVMNLALNNAANVARDYSARGHEVEIEIVAYGPGLHMLRADTSPVAGRIRSFGESMPNVAFAACGNTKANMEKKEGKAVEIMPDVKIVPAGVVRLMELQEQGWTYLRP